MSLEKQIKDAWKYYKNRSRDCHEIAQRVKNRKVLGTIFAYPEEIKKYDEYARELRDVEEYTAKRMKEYQRRYKPSKEDLKFNVEQTKRIKENLAKEKPYEPSYNPNRI